MAVLEICDAKAANVWRDLMERALLVLEEAARTGKLGEELTWEARRVLVDHYIAAAKAPRRIGG